VWRELHVNFSYTMEASFCGMSIGPYKGQHLNIHHLENMGKHLCQTLAYFADAPGYGNVTTVQKSDSPQSVSVPILPSVGPHRKGLKPKSHRSASNLGLVAGAKAKPKAKPKKT
jgi:hypothetical protein